MGMFDVDFDPFDRPVPGQGLTSDPDNPPPWRTPPVYSNPDEAYRYIMQKITDPAHIGSVLDLFRDNASISMVAQNLLMGMFSKGLITHDMLLLLAKPVMQAMYILCLRAGIEPKISHAKSKKVKQRAQIEALRMAEEMGMNEEKAVSFKEPEMEMIEEEAPAKPTSLLGVR